MAVAQSSSGGVALRYVLPVVWMTSRLAVMSVKLATWQGFAALSVGDQLHA